MSKTDVIAELRSMLAKATPGPLIHIGDGEVCTDDVRAICVADVDTEPLAELIVAAVNALPDLLSRVERVEADVAGLIDWMRGKLRPYLCVDRGGGPHEDCKCWWCEMSRVVNQPHPDAALLDELKRLRDENARLREVVAKLPTTADGAPIAFPMTIFRNVGGAVREELAVGVAHNTTRDFGALWIKCDSCTLPADECYSTREAALTAKGQA